MKLTSWRWVTPERRPAEKDETWQQPRPATEGAESGGRTPWTAHVALVCIRGRQVQQTPPIGSVTRAQGGGFCLAAGTVTRGWSEMYTWDRPEQDAGFVDSGKLTPQIRQRGKLPRCSPNPRIPGVLFRSRADTHAGSDRVPTKRPTRKPSLEGECCAFPLGALLIGKPRQLPT